MADFIFGIALGFLLALFLYLCCVHLFPRRWRWALTRSRRNAMRRLYRRGIVSGYRRCEEKWLLARRREMLDAGRVNSPRADAGEPAKVTKIRFQSGR